MLKLMKYEFRKQALSKAIILLLVLVSELVFFIGVIAKEMNIISASNAILQLILLITIGYLFMDPVSTFHSDLGKKQGYLLFMTPNSNYQIVGAKVLVGAIQMFVSFTLFIGIFSINQVMLSWKYGFTVVHPLEENFNAFGDIGFSFREFAVAAVMLVLFSICFSTLAFLATSISYSIFSKGKLNNFISFLIFIALFVIEMIILGCILVPAFENINVTNAAILLTNFSIVMALPIVINYVGVCVVLDKKVSL